MRCIRSPRRPRTPGLFHAAVRAGVMLPLLTAMVSRAEDPAQTELQSDAVLRAMVDELQRNKDELMLTGLTRPYFIEYALSDSTGASVSATLGTVTDRRTDRSRPMQVELRVGSYQLDNTNFGGGYGYWGGYGGGLPIENDYTAIRQSLWWATDRQYKSVTETFERKKAFMESKMIEDKPDDFSRELPVVALDKLTPHPCDTAALETLAVPLSEVFRHYAAVQQSSVSVSASSSLDYLVNSEGTRMRMDRHHVSVSGYASVQAPDGMPLSDSFSIDARELSDLPKLDELVKRCHALAEQLTKLAAAPKLDAYTGPVLFDARPATQVFYAEYASRFCGGQRPVGGETSPDDFENKIGQRILPKFFNVVDDPTREKIEDRIVMGHYLYDDEGVKAMPVALVEKGRLAGLLMSRNPSKKFKRSNGHGRGLFGASAQSACLIVTAEGGKSDDELKKDLIEAAKDEDLPFGIRIASLAGDDYGTMPLVMYKVFPDGHEEMVRGAQISRLDLKEFKRIRAAGVKPYIMNSGDSPAHTVAAPAMLFEELDLAKIDRDFDKPPIIESPVARALKEKS